MKKAYIFLLLITVAHLSAFAQQPQTKQDATEDTQLQDNDIKAISETSQKKPRFFQSISAGVDVVGPVINVLSNQGDYQAFVQLNIKGRYLPVVELGYGMADKEDYYTKIKYKAKAPFGRIGCDFNLLKNKLDNYRLTAGIRYGYTHFNYDTSTPDSTKTVFTDTSGKCTLHWAELVLGVDAKIWGPLHMGWSVRYRRRISCKYDDCDPLYAPGFGNAAETSRWMALYTIGIQI